LLIKKSFKRLLTPPKRRLNFRKSESRKPDLRKLERERDVLDSSHQSSAHSKSSKS